MKAKKIYKALKQLRKYCSGKSCGECPFQMFNCILHGIPASYHMADIKICLEKMK